MDINKIYKEAIKFAKKTTISDITITLPFISFSVQATDIEKKIAREIIIRVRDKRVITSFQCCPSCTEYAIISLNEIRAILIDKQVELNNVDSVLFLLIDFALDGIRNFMSNTENLKVSRHLETYKRLLQELREHLLRVFDQVSKIAELSMDFGCRSESAKEWDKKQYYISEGLMNG